MTSEKIGLGTRVVWPNGHYDRFDRPKGYHRGEVVALDEGVGGTCLKVKEDGGAFYYPHPDHVEIDLKRKEKPLVGGSADDSEGRPILTPEEVEDERIDLGQDRRKAREDAEREVERKMFLGEGARRESL